MKLISQLEMLVKVEVKFSLDVEGFSDQSKRVCLVILSSEKGKRTIVLLLMLLSQLL
jgi:hypothetical protein